MVLKLHDIVVDGYNMFTDYSYCFARSLFRLTRYTSYTSKFKINKSTKLKKKYCYYNTYIDRCKIKISLQIQEDVIYANDLFSYISFRVVIIQIVV